MSVYNVVSGKKSVSSITSHSQIPYQNYEFLKSNPWTNSRTGGKTVDNSRGQIFESNSINLKKAIDKVQERKYMTERQIRFNNKDSNLMYGGGGSSNPIPYGKKPTMDYYKLKQGLQDTTPKLSQTDWQLILLGTIAIILFLKR